MPRPEGWRLDPANYPVSLECSTRFQDMDVNRHLNNVAFAALFENARVQLHLDARLGENRAPGERTLVAAVEINYLGEGRFPEPVTICSGIGEVRNTSWTIWQAMFQKGRCIATCDSTIVNRANGVAFPVRPELRAELEASAAKSPKATV